MNIYCSLTPQFRKPKQCLQTTRSFKDHRCSKVKERLLVQSASREEACECVSGCECVCLHLHGLISSAAFRTAHKRPFELVTHILLLITV